jgi:cobalt/nickel transport system permease protein
MHITEGIITGSYAIATTGAGVALMSLGVRRMKRFAAEFPDKKPILGMGGALIFFLSLIPIPAFTGTCSHPCGTPLIGILLGPSIGIALTGISLLLQAAFFAHGGFGTWGANLIALGVFGCLGGWLSFKAARKLGLPLWAAGFAAGLIGDLLVYASSGAILALALVNAPQPQYSLIGYLTAVYSAYLPTQLPIALGEMAITGLALQYAYRQRPEVLQDLGVVPVEPSLAARGLLSLMVVAAIGLGALLPAGASAGQDSMPPARPTVSASENPGSPMTGMDEAVNEHLAEAAGRPARDPYLNAEALGDVWNLLLLSAGGICGFIVGRYWDHLWGRPAHRSPVSKATT